jgi:uncharacterized protein (TIGR00661 family)
MILQRYAPATRYVGLHFQPYDNFIFPPVVKDIFQQANPMDLGHITVYLSAYQQHCIEHHFRALPHLHFHWFLKGTKEVFREGNITYYPISNDLFNQSLIDCQGIITGGGFETPAEALYLGKRLMCIPIRGQYEQLCNAAALQQMGVTILADADTDHFAADIANWIDSPLQNLKQEANKVPETLEYLVNLSDIKTQPANNICQAS